MMPAVIMFVYIGDGFFACASALKMSHFVMRFIVFVVAVAAAYRSFWVMDQSSNIYSSEFGRALLEPLPHNALVLVMTDLATNSMRYVQAVDRYRADVFVMDQNLMSTDWFMPNHAKHFFGVSFPATKYWPSDPSGYDMKEFLDGNFGRFRIFVFPHFKDNSAFDGGYSLIPFGYMEEVVHAPTSNVNTHCFVLRTAIGTAAGRRAGQPVDIQAVGVAEQRAQSSASCSLHIQRFGCQVPAGLLGV